MSLMLGHEDFTSSESESSNVDVYLRLHQKVHVSQSKQDYALTAMINRRRPSPAPIEASLCQAMGIEADVELVGMVGEEERIATALVPTIEDAHAAEVRK